MRVDRILIADDHVVVRHGLRALMKDLYPFAEFDEAVNGTRVTALVQSNDYNIIVLDITMPETDCIELVTNILAYKEKSRILIFSMNAETLYAKRYLKLGVLGYLHKESEGEEIRKAIGSVLNGTIYMSPNLKKFLYDDMLQRRTDNPFEKLSSREIEIAKYLLRGYSHSDIKKELKLHSSTIGTHKIRFFEKLKIKNIFELRELARIYKLDLN
jgi:two-component system, NarL family, invasion response regulator UvrY